MNWVDWISIIIIIFIVAIFLTACVSIICDCINKNNKGKK